MAAYTPPKPAPVSTVRVRSLSKAPGKPTPERASTIHNGKNTYDPVKRAKQWSATGITNAGQNVNPNKPGKAFPTGAKNGKSGAVATAKKHAAADTSTTDYLAPLSQGALTKQAKTTISAAYKPSFGDLNAEQKQLAAINAKRAQDNTAYQNWATGQEQSILAQGSAEDANFSAAVGAANQALAGAAPSSAALVAQANARQGNVSENATSNQLGAGGTVDQNTARVNASNAINSVENLSNVQNSGDLLRSDAINANSRIGDNEAGQAATAQQQLTDIGTQRSKLQLSKAGDIAKEIARLQGVEIQKAQSAQQLQLAKQTLTANTANQTAQNANARAQINASVTIAGIHAKEYFAGLDNARAIAKYEQLNENQRAALAARTGLTENEQRVALGNKEYLLNVQKVGILKASTIWKQNHPNAGKTPPKGPNAGNPGNSPLTAHEQQEDYNQIDATTAIINAALSFNNGPGRDTDVYKALASGQQIQVGGNAAHPVYKEVPPVPPAILNAALDLSDSRSGTLPPSVVAKLRQIGLRHVNTHYTVA